MRENEAASRSHQPNMAERFAMGIAEGVKDVAVDFVKDALPDELKPIVPTIEKPTARPAINEARKLEDVRSQINIFVLQSEGYVPQPVLPSAGK